METNQIIENNKLIAEFMGFGNSQPYQIESHIKETPNGESSLYFDNQLDYNTSWNWLMPVVEKIESLKEKIHSIDVQICVDRVAILVNAIPLYMDIRQFSKKTKIEAVYYAVIDFIKWYNLNKQNHD